VKLFPLRGEHRLATTVGLIVVACHSGEARNLLGVELEPDTADAGNDAAVGNSASGAAGTSSAGGNPAQLPDASNGGSDVGHPDGGTGGIDDSDAASDATGADASDAESNPDIDAGPRCGDLELDEECDDGNAQHSDGCEVDCKKTTVVQASFGKEFNCALSSGGGVKCWGVDANGSLGRGTLGADVALPSQIEPLDFGTARRVTQISAGFYHTCVRFEDGKARCWGDNATGQLGINSTNDYGDDASEQLSALDDLPLDNVQSITAGIFGTCAILGNVGQERIFCWGGNLRGEQGVGDKLQREVPGQAAALGSGRYPMAAIIGWRWVCGLLNTGAVRCWGDDSYGVRGVGVTATWLGDNELPDSDTYNALGLPGPVTAFSGTYGTVCAISGGDAYCWGRNTEGRCGYPAATYGTSIWQTPRKVEIGDVSLVQIVTAGTQTCSLDDQGFVRCWGTDTDGGSLGYPGVITVGIDRDPVLDYELMQSTADGGIPDAGPVTPGLPLGAIDLGDFDETPGPDRAVAIEGSSDRTCAIMETGGLRCWGQNLAGLVGYPEADFIGYDDSPAQAYQRIGYSDVNVFGPPPAL
jgi:cysteine-rich repeat protein